MGQSDDQKHALVRSVEAAKRTAHWWQGGVFVMAILAILGVIALTSGKFVGGAWFMIFKGAAALGALAGVKAGAHRARRAARQLPDPEAIAILKPLTEHRDETTRKIAAELVHDLRPEGTEVVPSAIPEGRGSEVASSPTPQEAVAVRQSAGKVDG
jgi:hypothetical protein